VEQHRRPDAPLRVALLGLGTVGRSVAERLTDPAWSSAVAARGLAPPRLVAVGVRDPERDRGASLAEGVRLTDDIDGLAVDPDVDVVVELIGDSEAASGVVERALMAGRSVVTANKALLARAGARLEALARASGAGLRYEGSVAGGVPILAPLVTDLAANEVRAVRGVVNGTTNEILSRMAEGGTSLEEALAQAQARGLAEADPRADIEGQDAAAKLAILTRLAFGGWPRPETLRQSGPALGGVPSPGITGVAPIHLARAADMDLRIRLVARMARLPGGALTGAVTPMAVPAGSPIGAVDGVTNVIEVIAEPVGRVAFRGPGAGGAATSSAVLADLLALARGSGSTWDALPPATEVDVRDDLEEPHPWLVILDLPFGASPPAAASDLGLATAGGVIVTAPMVLEELVNRLAGTGMVAALYPVLADA
jgi:homoserine dehydrogenase